MYLLLAHLSTKCSWWAVVVSGCPSSVVVCRASSVVHRPSKFDVFTLETTFVIRFLWNLVRMFVLTISSKSSNIGHVWSKTRSPGQILGNFCLLWGPNRRSDFYETSSECLLTISRPSSNMGHVGSNTRSPG